MTPKTENRLLNIILVVSMTVIGILILLGALNLYAKEQIDNIDKKTVVETSRFLPYVGDVAGFYKRDGDEFMMVFKPDLFPSTPFGTCDTEEECTEKLDELCGDAGHGGADEGKITDLGEGEKMCSGSCNDGSGAVAFVICKPSGAVKGPGGGDDPPVH